MSCLGLSKLTALKILFTVTQHASCLATKMSGFTKWKAKSTVVFAQAIRVVPFRLTPLR